MLRKSETGELNWIKSSFSGASGDCVEVAVGEFVYVRDSKSFPGGTILVFTHDEFKAFTEGVKAGEFDLS